MSIISYDFGHMEGGQDTSANGFLYEYKVIREYAPIVVEVLKRAGHSLVNCTPPDNSNLTLNQSLEYRANRSNASNSVLHLCFHVNSFSDPVAHGSEVEYSSSNGAKYAQSVLNEIVALGFSNRGIKNPSLYMTGSHVNAVSILTEIFFVSNRADCDLYNKLGAIGLGNAIAKGVLNVIGGEYHPYVIEVVPAPIPKPTVKYCAHVQNIGWQNPVVDGAIAGTVGQSLRMEALNVVYAGDGKLVMEGQIQDIGWTPAQPNGSILGTMGMALRLETIKLHLEGSTHHIEYCGQVENIGWLPWVRDGEVCGTVGKSLRLEAVKIRIV